MGAFAALVQRTVHRRIIASAGPGCLHLPATTTALGEWQRALAFSAKLRPAQTAYRPALPQGGAGFLPFLGTHLLLMPPAVRMGGILLVFGAVGFQQIRIGNQVLLQRDRERPGIRFRIVHG